jgi:hypothetical protein
MRGLGPAHKRNNYLDQMGYWLDRTGLIVGTAGSLLIAGMFVYGAVTQPTISHLFTVGAAAVFAILAVLCGCRAFGSDEWFRQREAKQLEWSSRHPWLQLVAIALLVWDLIAALARHS